VLGLLIRLVDGCEIGDYCAMTGGGRPRTDDLGRPVGELGKWLL